jgi:MoxR-like ATPase
MNKNPVDVSVAELEELLSNYLDSGPGINFAMKIVGHPGVGKSSIVRQVAERKQFLFMDTRLAFKENIDLGGYPVPDHTKKRMIYFRPRFIPPEEVPEGYQGILWFLDEANRAHPTVIQTLFQIITERMCGEHADRKSVV